MKALIHFQTQTSGFKAKEMLSVWQEELFVRNFYYGVKPYSIFISDIGKSIGAACKSVPLVTHSPGTFPQNIKGTVWRCCFWIHLVLFFFYNCWHCLPLQSPLTASFFQFSTIIFVKLVFTRHLSQWHPTFSWLLSLQLNTELRILEDCQLWLEDLLSTQSSCENIAEDHIILP